MDAAGPAEGADCPEVEPRGPAAADALGTGVTAVALGVEAEAAIVDTFDIGMAFAGFGAAAVGATFDTVVAPAEPFSCVLGEAFSGAAGALLPATGFVASDPVAPGMADAGLVGVTAGAGVLVIADALGAGQLLGFAGVGTAAGRESGAGVGGTDAEGAAATGLFVLGTAAVEEGFVTEDSPALVSRFTVASAAEDALACPLVTTILLVSGPVMPELGLAVGIAEAAGTPSVRGEAPAIDLLPFSREAAAGIEFAGVVDAAREASCARRFDASTAGKVALCW